MTETAGHFAMLGFSTAAWKLAPRDTFIGWTRQLREKNLPFVVDNPRFLILPWNQDPQSGLAHPRHHPPAPARGTGPSATTPRPCSSRQFVETPRYTGAVYRASGWIHVGATQGARALRPGQAVRQAEKRMSGSGPCDETGNAASIAKIRRGGMETPALIPPPERTITRSGLLGRGWMSLGACVRWGRDVHPGSLQRSPPGMLGSRPGWVRYFG